MHEWGCICAKTMYISNSEIAYNNRLDFVASIECSFLRFVLEKWMKREIII